MHRVRTESRRLQAKSMLELTRALSRASQHQDRSFCSDAGLSSTQWQVLAAVRDGEPLPMGQLARQIHVTRSTATRLVDLLEKRGLVKRRPTKEDRRRQELVVTDEGADLADELDAAGIEVQRQVLAKIPERQRTELIEALGTVVDAQETWVTTMLPLDG